jgi:transposase-like protein
MQKEKKMGKQDKERRVYTKEFKAGAAVLAGKHGKPARQTALDLGINENQLYQFMQENRGQYTIREKDASIRGQPRCLLQMGEERNVTAA